MILLITPSQLPSTNLERRIDASILLYEYCGVKLMRYDAMTDRRRPRNAWSVAATTAG